MLTVHHLGISQSERVVWLLEELEMAYDLVRYDRDPINGLAPSEYKALYPFGTAPVLNDGALRLGESGAIIEYIIHTYGGGRFAVAPGTYGYTDYLFWWHFANASMMPAALMRALFPTLDTGDSPVIRSLTGRLDLAYDMVEARLGEARYFAGDELTAADIVMLFPLTTMRRFGPRDLSRYPDIRAYLQRIGDRPAYRTAMARADPETVPLLD